MEYLKKVIVLKQVNADYSVGNKPVNAIARIELENGVADLHLSIINLMPVSNGSYFAFIIDDECRLFSFSLGKRPLSFSSQFAILPSIEKGFSVGIYFVKDFIPTLTVYAKSENYSFDKTFLNKKVAEYFMESLKNQKKEEPVKSIVKDCPVQENQEDSSPCVYDDEAVATENYFLAEEKLNARLEQIKEYSRERISDENEFFDCRNQKEESKNQENASCLQDEKDTNCHKSPAHYLKVKDDLDLLFNKFEEELSLKNLFSDSKWAKINYSKDKFYVVGVVKEGGIEKYICYGVPDNYSPTPPKELDGFCTFIPLSKDDQKGKGYWMMFQDAESGNCIKPIVN